MAMQQDLAIKCVMGDNDFELEADPGEAFLIKDIQIYSPASNYVTLRTQKTTVGYFRVGGTLGSHLPFLNGRSAPRISDHASAAIADHAIRTHSVTQPDNHPAHSHKALTVKGTDSAADKTAFVSIVEGDGTAQTGIMVAHAGSGSDVDIMTDELAATAHANAAVADHAALAHAVTQAAIHSIASIPMLGMKTILGDMIGRAVLGGYPVAEGEAFTITGAKQSGAIVLVTYEVYEPGDISPEDPNGSRAKNYTFIQYGNAGANINTDGDTLYETCKSPAEFPDFPFGKVVPANNQIDLLAILASDFAPSENDGTDDSYTKYLKLIYHRETLFDEDRNGLLLYAPTGVNLGSRDRVAEGQSIVGNYSAVDMRPPLYLPAPISFMPGDELLVYLTTGQNGSGQNIAIDEHEIGLIQQVIGG